MLRDGEGSEKDQPAGRDSSVDSSPHGYRLLS